MCSITGLFGILLFCFAGSTSADSTSVLARAAFDAGHCEDASGLFLVARQEGDSSFTSLVGLARSLECMGRLKEALGATYMVTKQDTTGRIDLLLERTILMRRFGLEELARQTEKEIGIVVVGEGAGSGGGQGGWVWKKVPSLSWNAGWTDQIDRPHLAVPLRHNDSMLSVNWQSSRQASQPISDSITLQGGSWQSSAGLMWGGEWSSGSAWIGPSGSLTLLDNAWGWRSASGGLDMGAYWILAPRFILQGSISGNRIWFEVPSGPMPTQDDLVGSISPSWSPSGWSLDLPQTLHSLRMNSDQWILTGSHAVSVSRELLPGAKISAGGSWSWNLDPSGPVDEYVLVRVVEGEGLDSAKNLYSAQLYTGKPLTPLNTSSFLGSGGTGSDLEDVQLPYSRNTDWTQVGANGAITLGPWASVTLVLSAQWAQTDYSHDQEGPEEDRSLAALGPAPDYALLVLRDSTTKNEFLVGSTTSSVPLVPWRYWKIHRRDQCWTTQVVAVWKPVRWGSLRAAWTWSKNISNLDNYVDGASYIRNVVSFNGVLSW
jgi:hypothetical protein